MMQDSTKPIWGADGWEFNGGCTTNDEMETVKVSRIRNRVYVRDWNLSVDEEMNWDRMDC